MTSPVHDQAVSEFTREVLDDLVRDRYSLRAWGRLLARSWERSLEDLRGVPSRTRSFLGWTALGSALGVAMVATGFDGSAGSAGAAGAAGWRALALWVPWQLASVFMVATHIGMVDDERGEPHVRLLLPNGLSYLRLSLASLALWPCLDLRGNEAMAPFYATFLVVLALSDVLDGWLARRMGCTTRMGRLLDPLSDVALVTFLSIGLWAAGLLPLGLFLLLLLRYPVLPVIVMVFFVVSGPTMLRPTIVGRATTLIAHLVLLGVGSTALLRPAWLDADGIAWALRALYIALGVNVIYLLYRGATWKSRRGE